MRLGVTTWQVNDLVVHLLTVTAKLGSAAPHGRGLVNKPALGGARAREISAMLLTSHTGLGANHKCCACCAGMDDG